MQERDLFNKYNDGRHWEKHPTMYAEKFINFLQRNNFEGLIIDIGCGNGRDVNVFSKKFNSMGIDYSEEEIFISKNNFPELNFEVQSVENLNVENSSVDAFFMINVIHYVNKEKAIEEVFRSLKSGGYLFIHFNMEISDINGNVDYCHSKEDIMKLVSDFKIVYENIFERLDSRPVKHKHKIMELILKKY